MILTEQAWSIKDLLYGKRALSFCGTHRVILSGRDSAILPARVANHSPGFRFSCLLMELAKFSHFTVGLSVLNHSWLNIPPVSMVFAELVDKPVVSYSRDLL